MPLLFVEDALSLTTFDRDPRRPTKCAACHEGFYKFTRNYETNVGLLDGGCWPYPSYVHSYYGEFRHLQCLVRMSRRAIPAWVESDIRIAEGYLDDLAGLARGGA